MQTCSAGTAMHEERTREFLWAKTRATGPVRFHPLLCHLLDVAAAALMLWEQVLPDSTRADITASLGLPHGPAGRLLAFWAGLHDIGKASPGFQALDDTAKNRLLEGGFRFPPGACRRHGVLTADTLRELSAGSASGSEVAASACGIAAAVAGHHGQFPAAWELSRLGIRDRGGDEWEAARRSLIDDLAQVLDVSVSVPPGLSSRDHPFFMFLAGLVCVADWVGSAECWFPFEPYPEDLHAYFDAARQKAVLAVGEIGWAQWRPSGKEISFTEFFGFESPNAMQERVIELPPRSGAGELVIIEAPMGEGKTEAALYLVDRWNRTMAKRGCYVAMPTQATANAMFDRFRCDYLANRYPDQYVDLQLVHGHAMLSNAYQQLRHLGQIWDQADDGTSPSGAVVAGEWFGYRKRGLLGPFGVGTVDQALLAAMQASHSFVRLFGLAGKAVVFDEVHAFDTYTSGLLDRLLSWLAAMGCPVVILSATLPPTRRRQLIEAYAGDVQVPEVPYPRTLRVSAGTVDIATWECDTKRVELGWIDQAGLADLLGSELADGGCAAVICNTVRGAQDTFQALRDRLPDEITLDLFHARFPFEERDRRERRAIRHFGKGHADRPKRAVLVATQVIEQSLDLDFDLMVSEVAPVDLLLQRSGRMHRHDRPRPKGLKTPRLFLLRPEIGGDSVPRFGNSRFVYGDHLLLKTWLALRDREHFRIPDDVEGLICEVYEREPKVEASGLADALRAAREKAELHLDHLQVEARRRVLPSPHLDEDFHHLQADLSLEEDNPELHRHYRALTRWQDRPSVEIVCLHLVDGQPHVRCDDTMLPVDLTAAPSDDLVEKLVRQAVRISGQAAKELLASDAPTGWRMNSLLRYHRAAVFDEKGRFAGDAFALRLDSELGIVITRDDEGDD